MLFSFLIHKGKKKKKIHFATSVKKHFHLFLNFLKNSLITNYYKLEPAFDFKTENLKPRSDARWRWWWWWWRTEKDRAAGLQWSLRAPHALRCQFVRRRTARLRRQSLQQPPLLRRRPRVRRSIRPPHWSSLPIRRSPIH